MKVQMIVGNEQLDFTVHTELNFDPANVFDVIGEQPGKLAWWTALVAVKEQELADFVVDMEARTSAIELDIRKNSKSLEDQYGKVTEGVIKAVLAANDEVVQLSTKMNEIKRDANILRAMAKGFDSRSSLMATAGSMHRAELEAGLRALTGRAKKGMME